MENNLRDSLIEDWANDGLSVKQIVAKLADKNIPTANKTVAKVLKNKGYTYNSSTFLWGRTELYSDLNVSNVITDSPSAKMEINNAVIIDHSQQKLIELLGFSLKEFDVLRGIINEKIEGQTKGSLIDEVIKLKITDRATKSYYISDHLTKTTKDIADKNNIKISNAIEVALIDFINKYS